MASETSEWQKGYLGVAQLRGVPIICIKEGSATMPRDPRDKSDSGEHGAESKGTSAALKRARELVRKVYGAHEATLDSFQLERFEEKVLEVASILDAWAQEALYKQMIEARRVLGTGQENFNHWLDIRIAALEQRTGSVK